jgi:hypothetical protein
MNASATPATGNRCADHVDIGRGDPGAVRLQRTNHTAWGSTAPCLAGFRFFAIAVSQCAAAQLTTMPTSSNVDAHTGVPRPAPRGRLAHRLSERPSRPARCPARAATPVPCAPARKSTAITMDTAPTAKAPWRVCMNVSSTIARDCSRSSSSPEPLERAPLPARPEASPARARPRAPPWASAPVDLTGRDGYYFAGRQKTAAMRRGKTAPLLACLPQPAIRCFWLRGRYDHGSFACVV